jgi:hypothetical protein
MFEQARLPNVPQAVSKEKPKKGKTRPSKIKGAHEKQTRQKD